jgi:hypothetical protein
MMKSATIIVGMLLVPWHLEAAEPQTELSRSLLSTKPVTLDLFANGVLPDGTQRRTVDIDGVEAFSYNHQMFLRISKADTVDDIEGWCDSLKTGGVTVYASCNSSIIIHSSNGKPSTITAN